KIVASNVLMRLLATILLLHCKNLKKHYLSSNHTHSQVIHNIKINGVIDKFVYYAKLAIFVQNKKQSTIITT
ncbi:hypothetical protein ACWIUH_11345, partial [Ursidibacter arcticus]